MGPSVVKCAGALVGGCGQEVCNPDSGQCQKLLSDGAPCDDGLPCSAESFCKAGSCVAGNASWCQCTTTADCAAKDDADLCNGSLFCDKAAFPFSCKVNPATVVTCPTTGDSACAKNVCTAASGKCALVAAELAKFGCDAKGCAWQAKAPNEPVLSVVTCSDGVACTTGDFCEAGSCKAGADTCSCLSNTDCAAQEDGNFCNGTLFCNKGVKPSVCQINPSTVITCANGNDTACEKNACAIGSGKCDCAPNAKAGSCTLSLVENAKQVCADGKCRWETLPLGASSTDVPACDDGNNCTKGEVCQTGSCGGGTDICVCVSDLECKSQEDGNPCNGTLFCNKASKKCELNPATVVTCPTGLDTACVKNVCIIGSGKCGLANAASSVTCDDGDSCTVGDTCSAGGCQAGTNTCSCTNDLQCAKYEDGDGCNGTMFCNKGKSPAICELNPATVVSCPSVDDTACLKNQCQPKTGKCGPTATADFSPCDDSNKCTKADSCLFGKCQAGTFTCECATNADCAAKDDGNLCNGTFYCDKSGDPKCVYNPASVVFCSKNDDSACLQAKCDSKTGGCGLVPASDGSSCDDGSQCSEKDACKAGKCGGSAIDCDDSNPCTVDGCDASGCTHKAANCADGNECTADQCDVKTGQCTFPAVIDGKSCNGDDDGCTVNDVCLIGKCKVGTAVVCKIALEACQVAACQSTGAKSFACVALPAKDGTVCSGSTACVLGHACQVGQCQPLPKDKLFVAGLGTLGKGLQLQAVQAIASGTVVAGRRSLGPDDSPSGAALVVAELSGNASATWQVEAASAGAFDDLVGVAAVQRLASGETAMVATRRFGATDELDLWVAKLAAAGKSFVADKQVLLAGTEAVFGAAYHPQVGWWAAGQQGTGSAARAWLVRLSEAGTVLASWKSTAAATDHLRATVILSDGGALAVGDRIESGVVRALLVRVDSQGATVWQKTLAEASPQGLVAIASSPAGLFAAGSRTSGGIDLPLLLQIDASGKVLASFVGTSAAAVRSLAVLTGGRAVLVGSVGAGDNSQAWSQGFAQSTPQGGLEPIWSNADLGSLPARWQSAAVSADGGLWLVGAKTKPIAALVGRADPWGHLSCLTAGSCADKTADFCDDKQGCTYDLCEPGTGCVNAPSSSLCTDSDACTVGDVCQAGACLSGDVTTCNDANPCTSDACDVKSGCSHGLTTSGCSDGDACTGPDSCAGGSCAGAAVKCDDGSICTTDSCDSKKGCVTAVNAKACDDANLCTDDSCNTKNGCAHKNNTDGCEAGNPCVSGDQCAAGACQAGSLANFYTAKLSGTPMLAAIVALAPTSDGSVRVGGDLQLSPERAVVGTIAAGGTAQPFAVVEKTALNYLRGITQIASGYVYVGATQALGAAGWDGWLHSTNADDKILWSYPYGGLKKDSLWGAAPMGDGVLAVGGSDSSGAGGNDGWIVLVNANGVQLKATTVGGPGDDYLYAISAVAAGGYIAAGYTDSWGAGGKDGWLVRLNSSGSVVWRHTYGASGDQRFFSVAATDDGGFAAVGDSGGNSGKAFIAKTDAAGDVFAYPSDPLNFWDSNAVAAIAGGFVVASGKTLRRFDNAGSVLWSQDSSAYGLHAIAVVGNHSLVIGGLGQSSVPTLWRTDAWGNASCAASGKCAGTTAQTCGDDNPCTVPGCDPATGCKPVLVVAPCDAGAACTTGDVCAAGSCVAGKPRLLDVAHGSVGADEYRAVVRSRLGGLLAAGLDNGAVSNAGLLARLSLAGDVNWQVNLINGQVNALAELADGRIVVGKHNGIRVFDATGQLLPTGPNAYNWVAQVAAIARVENDDFVAVGYNDLKGAIAVFNARVEPLWASLGNGTQWCRSVTVRTNGELEVWCSGPPNQAVLIRLVLSASGQKISSDSFAQPAELFGFGHVVDALGNTYALASHTVYNQGSKARVAVYKFDAKGTMVWQRSISAPGHRFGERLVLTGAGPVVVGTAQADFNNSLPNGWLAGIDPSGNLGWQRQFGGLGWDGFRAGVVVEDNLVSVGHTSSKGAGDLDRWLVRTDAWGQGPCSQSGPCVKLPAATCLDDQACTADSCSPIDGCVHEKSSCDDSNPCTTDACDAKLGCQWTLLSDGATACPNSGKCALGYCP
ncbi:MAG: hypothetical protein EXR77_07680 [Myxococcales bacterium]|nr:hypothetical protein [Myxococcales bacterium]